MNLPKGCVLLTPEDAHTFKIIVPTRFCIIDFTKSFFLKVMAQGKKWMLVIFI